jgi:hypothetical protein
LHASGHPITVSIFRAYHVRGELIELFPVAHTVFASIPKAEPTLLNEIDSPKWPGSRNKAQRLATVSHVPTQSLKMPFVLMIRRNLSTDAGIDS